MLEEENKKETQESEQVPAAERIQEPEAVQSQESEPAQTQDCLLYTSRQRKSGRQTVSRPRWSVT